LEGQIKKGFTLIELLIVSTIILILASVVLVNMTSARAKARDSARASNLKELQTAIDLYFENNYHYPEKTAAGDSYISLCNEAGMATVMPSLGVSLQSYLPSMPQEKLAEHTGYAYCPDLASGSQEYAIGADMENTGAYPSQFTGTFFTNTGGLDMGCNIATNPGVQRNYCLAKCDYADNYCGTP